MKIIARWINLRGRLQNVRGDYVHGHDHDEEQRDEREEKHINRRQPQTIELTTRAFDLPNGHRAKDGGPERRERPERQCHRRRQGAT